MSERAEAVAGLRAAVERVRRAYGLDEGLLTDWVLVFARQRFRDDGRGETAVESVTGDPPPPQYRVAGLLDDALWKLRTSGGHA